MPVRPQDGCSQDDSHQAGLVPPWSLQEGQCVCRAAYEAGKAVIRIHNDEPAPLGFCFFFVGFGNMQTNDFTLQPLEPPSDAAVLGLCGDSAESVVLEAFGLPRDHDVVGQVLSPIWD